MSEQPRPLLPLSPAERRIAEVAFASGEGDADSACRAVFRLHEEYARRPTVSDVDAMLAELRSEPEEWSALGKQLAAERIAAAEARAERYRALLERISENAPSEEIRSELRDDARQVIHNAPTGTDADLSRQALAFFDALDDIRTELAR